jgi:hypothetical protein
MEPHCKLEPMDKTKFLVDEEFRVQNLINIIRKNMKLLNSDALFIFFGDKKPKIATGDKYIRDVYENFKDSDGFLYVIYASQQIWGK